MADGKNNSLPVEILYEGRQNFTIVGLTGISGSGCSRLAEYMGTPEFMGYVRSPEEICIKGPVETNNEKSFHENKQNEANVALNSMVFKQKYSICYNFAKNDYQAFTVIKYTKVIWLYALLYIKEKIENGGGLKDFIKKILLDKYKPSIKEKDNDYRDKISDRDRETIISELIDNYAKWDDLAKSLQLLPENYISNLYDSEHDIKALADFYFKDENFKDFFESFLHALGESDLYSLCFFHHRMAYQIRKSGNLNDEYDKIYEIEAVDYAHLYDLIRLVNLLIKGYQRLDVKTGKQPCRIVIDSLRNSMEAQYLKERYSAFYLIAVNSKNRQTYLQRAVISKSKKDVEAGLTKLMLEKIDRLSMEEVKISDYTAGDMASPDIENVIADAEIHISNNVEENAKKETSYYEFYSMAEQWMKYYSLIMHPGLITPSADERCMVVAYTAKFNSSCISRQVGAVITNQYHSIRTIGWNEVPYGQMPCGLRDISNVDNNGREICHDCEYSEFERGKGEHGSFYNGKGFNECIKKDYVGVDEEYLAGLPKPYCFKSLHNRYEGEKNQVFTRSLHAEENAILQMAKYGGEPLMNGIIYVTASPCELCSKKLYQIGVRKIVYIDPYPGIARQHIIKAGFKQPELQLFQGAYGTTYFKLYKPFMPYKDEFDIRTGHHHNIYSSKDLLNKILEKLGIEKKGSYTKGEIEQVISKIGELG